MNPLIAIGVGLGFVSWGIKKLAGEQKENEPLTVKTESPITPITEATTMPTENDPDPENADIDNSE